MGKQAKARARRREMRQAVKKLPEQWQEVRPGVHVNANDLAELERLQSGGAADSAADDSADFGLIETNMPELEGLPGVRFVR